MNVTTRVLRTAFVTAPPAYTECFHGLPNDKQRCDYPGIRASFYEQLSKMFKVRFLFTQANSFGNGDLSENNSVFQLLRAGKIDFIGPYFFNQKRDNVATRSDDIIYNFISIFTAINFAPVDFELKSLLGPVVFSLACAAFIGIAVLGSYHIRKMARSRHFRYFTRISTSIIVFCLILLVVILNLYVSLLSVKVVQQEPTAPPIKNLRQLQNLVIDRGMKVSLIGESSQRARLIVNTLMEGLSGTRLEKLNAAIVYSRNNKEMLDLVERERIIGIGDTNTEASEAWLFRCDKLVRGSSRGIFADIPTGFYFTKSNVSDNNLWFQNLVNKHKRAIESLHRSIRQTGMTRNQDSVKCLNGWKVPPSYTISLKTSWNVIFKGIWCFGLFSAVFALGLEKLCVKIRLKLCLETSPE